MISNPGEVILDPLKVLYQSTTMVPSLLFSDAFPVQTKQMNMT